MEEVISPALRLAICLYRLDRGEYLNTIVEIAFLSTGLIWEICLLIIAFTFQKVKFCCPLENTTYNMLPYCLLSTHYILVVSKQRTQHTEVVHAPQACIFHALKVRGMHIFRSSCHFVAKQVMCAWQNMLNLGKKIINLMYL